MRHRVLVLLAVSASALTFANLASADTIPLSDRYLSDPAYLPLEGQIEGTTSVTMGDSRANIYDSAGAFAAHIYDQTDSIGQSLNYGITDDLTLNLGDTYRALDKRTLTAAGGGGCDTQESGYR